MKTLRRYLWKEVLTATLFVLFALLALFTFFELVGQLSDVGQRGYQMKHAIAFVLLELPARTYELMPIAALIGTIYALSKLAASSEFTIMRVSGMSTGRLMLALLQAGLVLLVATYLLGEVAAPPAENLAQRFKLDAKGAGFTPANFRSGMWIRDVIKDGEGTAQGFRFVNVRDIQPGGKMSQWRVYEFDPQFRLRSLLTAQRGSYDPGFGWTLEEVVETHFPLIANDATAPTTARTEVVYEPKRAWNSALRPDIFGVMMVMPERMAAYDLSQYIDHLSENKQQTDRYQIAFWSKVFYPLAILVMITLALPFAYLHVRAGGVSLKIFTGVMIGVAFYGLNKLFAHLGLLNTWPPVLVSILPSLVMLAVALAALYWIERR